MERAKAGKGEELGPRRFSLYRVDQNPLNKGNSINTLLQESSVILQVCLFPKVESKILLGGCYPIQ